VIRPGSKGVASIRKESCPFCRAEQAEAKLEEVRGREKKLERFALAARDWRDDCWDYDSDMGHERRDFSDDDEWDRLAEQALRAIADKKE